MNNQPDGPGSRDPVEPIRSRDELLQRIRPFMNKIRASYNVQSLALFGSAVRDSLTAESDVDILVEFQGPPTSDDYFELKFFLEDILGWDVDLVTLKGLRPVFRSRVTEECIPIE
tara:strand:- start:856 stop:1200 length:345 start_codon:yes stop_codon:yes gene_type:complete